LSSLLAASSCVAAFVFMSYDEWCVCSVVLHYLSRIILLFFVARTSFEIELCTSLTQTLVEQDPLEFVRVTIHNNTFVNCKIPSHNVFTTLKARDKLRIKK
jgi:hypothetical protein